MFNHSQRYKRRCVFDAPETVETLGKRLALSKFTDDLNQYATNYCLTTNIQPSREHLRNNAHPEETNIPPIYRIEQLRDTLAHSMNDSSYNFVREPNSTSLLLSNPNSRAVESSQTPRQSESVKCNQAIPNNEPVRPTQQQLAAKQSLAKELPR